MDPRLRRKVIKCVRRIRTIPFTDACNEYDIIVIDLASIVYGLRRPVEFLKNLSLAQTHNIVRSRFVIVLDYSREIHVKVSNRYITLIRDLGLEYVLSENEPAEIRAAKICREHILRGHKCIVLSRDYDPLTIVDEELMPSRRHFAWTVDHVMVDRRCLESLT
ncbi:MAG: hypothetical protein GXO23_04950 [Crenarchaeota archaeon]|nr:hypothetical protein [Thermoproteota archaeon]